MGGYLDAMMESIRTLQMRFHVPNTQVFIGGDFNAHVSSLHDKGGRPLQCGEVQDDVLGLSFEGGSPGARTYSVLRSSQSTVRICKAHTPRGDAVNRACRNHGLLLLNGRALSDRQGVHTHY